jgi:hypothetical protein
VVTRDCGNTDDAIFADLVLIGKTEIHLDRESRFHPPDNRSLTSFNSLETRKRTGIEFHMQLHIDDFPSRAAACASEIQESCVAG